MQRILKAERAEDLDGIRPDLQPGADLFESGRALIQRNIEPALAQRAGGCESADPGADDGDAKSSLRWPLIYNRLVPHGRAGGLQQTPSAKDIFIALSG